MKRPVRIAILDSGVHLAHPHIGGVTGGKDCTGTAADEACFPECCIDLLGHGTAVAALIHHLAPEAELLAVRIFHRQLNTNISVVMRAIQWALGQQIDLLNLSFGTTNASHRQAFEGILIEAQKHGMLIISPYESSGTNVLPGTLKEVMGVMADPSSPEGTYRVLRDEEGIRYLTAPYPRAIPGVLREDNLSGVSFSTASLTGQIAQLWQHYGPQRNWPAFLEQYARDHFATYQSPRRPE